jgi:hypothetical protein
MLTAFMLVLCFGIKAQLLSATENPFYSKNAILGSFDQACSALRIKAAKDYGYDIATFQSGHNSLLLIGKSLPYGYNEITCAGDIAFIYTDGFGRAGSNLKGGITIAPWSHADQASGLRITSEGKVGIGCAEPAEQLDIAGGLRLRGKAVIDSTLVCG